MTAIPATARSTTDQVIALVADSYKQSPETLYPDHVAKQLLIASLHHCGAEIWHRAFPHETGMPKSIAALHLEDSTRVDRILSPALFASLLESVNELPLSVGLRDYFVHGPTVPSITLHQLAREPIVGQQMPVFGRFCRDLFEMFGVASRYWLAYYVFACSSILHAADSSAEAVLGAFSLRPEDQVKQIIKWMRRNDEIIFSDEATKDPEKWRKQYVDEWRVLGYYVQTKLSRASGVLRPSPKIDKLPTKPTPAAPTSPSAAVNAPAVPVPPARTAPVPPARTTPPAPVVGGAAKDKKEGEEEEEEEEGEAAVDLDEEEKKKNGAAGGEKKEEEEEEEEEEKEETKKVDGTTPVAAELSIPPLESIAHKCKHRSTCKKERLDHEFLGDFIHQYGLPSTIASDQAYRLALIRLFADRQTRPLLVDHYWTQPHQLIMRLDQVTRHSKLEKHHCCHGQKWHEFLAPFDSVDTQLHPQVDLLQVRSFNDAVNSVAPPGCRATAHSACIRRYLTAHKGGREHWRPLWRHAYGEPTADMSRVIDGYLAQNPGADPHTMAHVLYLVPKPSEA